MEKYIRAYRALLAGEAVDWEDAPIKMMLTSEQADALPLQIPLLISAIGPKGAGVAQCLGADGIISMFQVLPEQQNYPRAVVAVFGTVIESRRIPPVSGSGWQSARHGRACSTSSTPVREPMPYARCPAVKPGWRSSRRSPNVSGTCSSTKAT
jgi:5,10-methylenetetrahydromethanopterin reductase